MENFDDVSNAPQVTHIERKDLQIEQCNIPVFIQI